MFPRHSTGNRCLTLLTAHGIVAIALLGACLVLFNAVDAVSLWLALLVAYVPLAITLAARVPQWRTLQFAFLPVALWVTIIAIAYAYDVAVAPPVTSFARPDLVGDVSGYWNQALHFYDGSRLPVPMTFYGTSLMMAALWHLFGVSIAWPLAMNVGFTLAAMLLFSWTAQKIVRRAYPHANADHLATTALLILATWGSFCSIGASLLKDAQVAAAIALVWAALAAATDSCARRRNIILLMAAGCLLLAFIRAKYLYFAALGVVMATAVPHPGNIAHMRQRAATAATLLTIVAVAWLIGNIAAGARYTVAVQMQTIAGDDMLRESFSFRPELYAIVGDYYTLGQIRRLLLTPFSFLVQLIIPLPWSNDIASTHEAICRWQWGWYAAAILAAYYYLHNIGNALCSKTAGSRQPSLGLLAWWPVAVAAIIAHLTAGSVSRYLLSVRPALLPAILMVIVGLRHPLYRRRVAIWFSLCTIALTITLIACQYLTHT